MKACVVVKPGTIEIRDIAKPQLGPYDSLVKIEVCGLCGTTDIQLIDGVQTHHQEDSYPAVLGHEAVGTVVEIGSKVKKFKPGDRVTRPVSIWPGICENGMYSAWGGFAEYGIVRDGPEICKENPELTGDYMLDRQNVVDPKLSALDASLAISLSETSSWLANIAEPKGKTVAVGGVGIAGVSIAMFAKLAGAEKVICVGRRKEPLDHALKCGADYTINGKSGDVVEQIRDICGGDGADIAIDCTGNSIAQGQMLDALRREGRGAFLGEGPKAVVDPLARLAGLPACLRIFSFNVESYAHADGECRTSRIAVLLL